MAMLYIMVSKASNIPYYGDGMFSGVTKTYLPRQTNFPWKVQVSWEWPAAQSTYADCRKYNPLLHPSGLQRISYSNLLTLTKRHNKGQRYRIYTIALLFLLSYLMNIGRNGGNKQSHRKNFKIIEENADQRVLYISANDFISAIFLSIST